MMKKSTMISANVFCKSIFVICENEPKNRDKRSTSVFGAECGVVCGGNH